MSKRKQRAKVTTWMREPWGAEATANDDGTFTLTFKTSRRTGPDFVQEVNMAVVVKDYWISYLAEELWKVVKKREEHAASLVRGMGR